MTAGRTDPALNGEVAAMLRGMRDADVFGPGFDPVGFRTIFEQMAPDFWNPASLPVGATRDVAIPTAEGGIAARVYWPDGTDHPLPILLFFHGGGFTSGSIHTADAHCRHFCRTAQCIVVNADYRLAPEHPFPAGLEDTVAATNWVATHAAELGGDPARIAIGGDAPGATFAAVNAIIARDRGGPPLIFQLLLGPATDFAGFYPRNSAILQSARCRRRPSRRSKRPISRIPRCAVTGAPHRSSHPTCRACRPLSSWPRNMISCGRRSTPMRQGFAPRAPA